MDKLPPELMSMILSYTVNDVNTPLHEKNTLQLDCASILTRLSLVCKQWKELCKSIKVKLIILEILNLDLVKPTFKKVLSLYPNIQNLELFFWNYIANAREENLINIWKELEILEDSGRYKICLELRTFNDIRENNVRIISKRPNCTLSRNELIEDLSVYIKLYKKKYDLHELY